jgi:hypothetical protein
MPDYSAYNADRTRKTCRVCGLMKPVAEFRQGARGKGIRNVCRLCEGAEIRQYRRGSKDGAVAEVVRRIRYRAGRAGLPFDLTKEWVRARLDEQEWACELTRVPFKWHEGSKEGESGFTCWASISADRIVPVRGYVVGNTRFILNAINLFKGPDGDDARIYMMAERLLEVRDGKV